MTPEDILSTLVLNDMITIRDEPAELMARKKRAQQKQRDQGGLARQAVSRTQQSGGSGPSVMPDDYTIHIDRPVLMEYLSRQAEKGYLQLRPERLKYTPFLVQRLALTKNGMIESKTVTKAQAVEVQGETPDFQPDASAVVDGQESALPIAGENMAIIAGGDYETPTSPFGQLPKNETQSAALTHITNGPNGLTAVSEGPRRAISPAVEATASGSAIAPVSSSTTPRTPSRKANGNFFSPSNTSDIGNNDSHARRTLRQRTSSSMTPAPPPQFDVMRRSTRSGPKLNGL